MKNALLFLLVCLLPLEVFGRQEAGSDQIALVFTNVTVIDATGAPAKPDMTVVVRGDRIAALGKTANLDVPQDAHVVDATGKFLIPGLWDMHIHPLNKKDYLALFIANGVTGVRVMRGEPVHHNWRREISAGKLIGPRMVIASPFIDGPDPIFSGSIIVSNEDEGRRAVRKVKKEGADLVKVFNDIPPDAYFAIADEAKKQGIPFAGHVPYLVSAAEASDAGQQSIEHCYFVLMACSSRSEEELKKKLKETLVTRPGSLPHVRARVKLWSDTYSETKAAELFARFAKNSTWVCPTLMLSHSLSFRDEEDLVNDPRLKYMPLSIKDSWKNDVYVVWATGEGQADNKKLCEKHLAIVGAMRRVGVGLLAGTDTTGVAYCFPGFGLHDELALFVQVGLSPLQALQTATYNPAKCLGKLDSMGTVERGKIADMVLLEANPLENISNTQKIAGVVFGGRFFDKTGLQKMLAQVEASRLHYAAAEGNIEHVKLLISEGADVNARDQQGWTPALVALYEGQLAVTNLLLEKGADTTTPHLAAYTGDLRGIKSLLEKDAPVDSLEGLTLLHAAAASGHTDVVEFLIAKGFKSTATTEDDETTPLHLAALSGHKEVAELLIANGADVNQENSSGGTPLHVAAGNGHRSIAELLIEAGAEVNEQKNNEWGETPLHYATWARHKDVAGLLIARGANVNARDNEQSTPLHFAANRGYKDLLELLIAKGADVSAKNQRGESPLSMAKAKGHNEIVELLRKHGAKE